MSVAAVSSNVSSPLIGPVANPYHQEHQDGFALEQALRSGDLGAAQTAYNALAAFGPNNSGPFVAPKLVQDFQALGQAISSGDLASAQQAALTLRQTYIKFQQSPSPASAPPAPPASDSGEPAASTTGINVQA